MCMGAYGESASTQNSHTVFTFYQHKQNVNCDVDELDFVSGVSGWIPYVFHSSYALFLSYAVSEGCPSSLNNPVSLWPRNQRRYQRHQYGDHPWSPSRGNYRVGFNARLHSIFWFITFRFLDTISYFDLLHSSFSTVSWSAVSISYFDLSYFGFSTELNKSFTYNFNDGTFRYLSIPVTAADKNGFFGSVPIWTLPEQHERLKENESSQWYPPIAVFCV